jgi:biopolymer transport protein ExbD
MALRTQVEEIPQLNLTAMIDVLFLLIIFFVIGTEFVKTERQIELTLPQVARNEALSAAPEKKIVNIYRDGQVTFERQEVSLDELETRLTHAREQYRALGVLVRGDGAVPFERVANVLSICKRAGISDLSISVEIAEASGKHARR